jgi:hypothetical protein
VALLELIQDTGAWPRSEPRACLETPEDEAGVREQVQRLVGELTAGGWVVLTTSVVCPS